MPNTGRSDYGFITMPDIPDDEPVFLLRAKDATAPSAVRAWADELRRCGGEKATVDQALDHADEMERYADTHYRGGKVPDAPAPKE
jgi:hypothetical protein